MEPLETILTAREVAERLGLSTSQVRRHAQAYERVYGELGKDSRGHRYYTLKVVEQLEAAHLAVVEGRAVSVESVLIAERDGRSLDSNPPRTAGILELVAKAFAEHSERLERIESALLADRDDLHRRLDYALGELKRRDDLEIQRGSRFKWFFWR